MKTESFTTKSFPLEGVRVTAENLDEVAKWCKGTVHRTDTKIAEQLGQSAQTWIIVPVANPLNEKQTQARPGDWVVFIKREFRVYTHASFKRNFEPVSNGSVHRSAESGQYVSEAVAHDNPATTVAETK